MQWCYPYTHWAEWKALRLHHPHPHAPTGSADWTSWRDAELTTRSSNCNSLRRNRPQLLTSIWPKIGKIFWSDRMFDMTNVLNSYEGKNCRIIHSKSLVLRPLFAQMLQVATMQFFIYIYIQAIFVQNWDYSKITSEGTI